MRSQKAKSQKIDTRKIFKRHPFASVLLDKLEGAGHEAVLVGGVVRDAIRSQLDPQLDFDPKEIDIATSALPAEMKRIFKGHKMRQVGESFGVLVILSPEGASYEVATFRTESDYDGRRPGRVTHVRELEADLIRRDFTVNGLAARRNGAVLDCVGGIHDLKHKIIRAIGDPGERFREDYLRLLRAVRFASVLDASLAPETLYAIKQNAEGLKLISAERIQAELLGLMATPRAAKGIRLLDELSLLEIILPELVACKGVPQPEKYHPEGDVFTHSLMALEMGDPFIHNPRVKLALLLHDIGKPMALQINQGAHAGGHDLIGAQMTADICRRLRMSNTETRFVQSLVREHQHIGQLSIMTRRHQVQYLMERDDVKYPVRDFKARFPWLTQLIRLMIADSEASAMRSKTWLPVLKSIQSVLGQIHSLDETSRAHKLISGDDLIAMGLKEGPEVGVILRQIFEAIFSGDVTTRDDALKLARELLMKSPES